MEGYAKAATGSVNSATTPLPLFVLLLRVYDICVMLILDLAITEL